MPKSVVLIPQLIQRASQQILPAEILDYDSLSYKQLSTWESRVSASTGASYIWMQIPQSLKRLRGSINPRFSGGGMGPPEHIVKRLLRDKFYRPVLVGTDNWHFATATAMNPLWNQQLANSFAGLANQFPPGQMLPILNPPPRSRRGGLLGLGLGPL